MDLFKKNLAENKILWASQKSNDALLTIARTRGWIVPLFTPTPLNANRPGTELLRWNLASFFRSLASNL
jgi:hypothetical protein